MEKEIVEEVRAFNRVYTVFMGLLNRSFLKSQYTLAETRVMHATLNKDAITPSEIVVLLNIDKSYLSRIITSLERRKVLVKSKSPSDGRSFRISITLFGRQEFEKLVTASNNQVSELLSELSQQQRTLLVKNMSEIRQLLEKR